MLGPDAECFLNGFRNFDQAKPLSAPRLEPGQGLGRLGHSDRLAAMHAGVKGEATDGGLQPGEALPVGLGDGPADILGRAQPHPGAQFPCHLQPLVLMGRHQYGRKGATQQGPQLRTDLAKLLRARGAAQGHPAAPVQDVLDRVDELGLARRLALDELNVVQQQHGAGAIAIAERARGLLLDRVVVLVAPRLGQQVHGGEPHFRT